MKVKRAKHCIFAFVLNAIADAELSLELNLFAFRSLNMALAASEI